MKGRLYYIAKVQNMKTNFNITGQYFYGNKISDYGIENRRVDYATLAKSFDCVLNNDIIEETTQAGFYWDTYCGDVEYYEDIYGNTYNYSEADDKITELKDKLDELKDCFENDEFSETSEEYALMCDIEKNIECLEDPHYNEIFQYFIVSNNGADILADAGEIVFYNETLDMYVWGVTHWGTSWDDVLTNIPCLVDEN